MNILVNENYEITGYALVGDISDSTRIDKSILPDGFVQSFRSRYYLYENGAISVNPNYTEPTISPSTKPTSQQTINANLLLQIATLTEKVTKMEGSAS
ncbi:DUF2977 domain-containing protein [Liquorilactobacillus nagelii]|uniref:DUF2977 domain-containing protein n=1 Tax=Liquorilactobacillus nagelii TaxID=82688 RepID=UPI00070BD80C|nr:DUF2977 domain-containing protein [Liquorilactobacillus nagelii]QYH53703.1 DUF2977 domain-containing protein [Liquorilactobacillus nagelii DSM 13675]